ncbi:hypothetical protein SS50377_22794 [Spironucleus salmonicida]|uniref:Uncharacterized protein n=1 Tax=Spironucleus salmonicida TaxID=348837 RepID=V6LCU6_9EUKA|nr:hypothetical protein SS50377_28786 [Spironucleus salmonicida]KAH0575167.1 hypothetical protein SS50377_22794 [Spironucleus salmonicida]|eukprot:EST42305.1 Hypothetical protein SS50377_18174 [Spironucleus salmonicida]
MKKHNSFKNHATTTLTVYIIQLQTSIEAQINRMIRLEENCGRLDLQLGEIFRKQAMARGSVE